MPSAAVLRLAGADGTDGIAVRDWLVDRGAAPDSLAATLVAPDEGPATLRIVDLSDSWLHRVLPEVSETIVIGGAAFRVGTVARDPADHPLAGGESWDDLSDRLTGRAPARFGFELLTPAVFRSADLLSPLPSVRSFYSDLLDCWNAFAPARLPEDVLTYAESSVAIDDLVIHGKRTAIGVRGAVGSVHFSAVHPDPVWLGPLAALSVLAGLRGVGVGVDRGLGLCRQRFSSGFSGKS